MKKDQKSSIARANERIHRNRQARKQRENAAASPAPNGAFETLNCANAFAKNGKSLEHLFDKLF